jgi:hypothetical protein
MLTRYDLFESDCEGVGESTQSEAQAEKAQGKKQAKFHGVGGDKAGKDIYPSP